MAAEGGGDADDDEEGKAAVGSSSSSCSSNRSSRSRSKSRSKSRSSSKFKAAIGEDDDQADVDEDNLADEAYQALERKRYRQFLKWICSPDLQTTFAEQYTSDAETFYESWKAGLFARWSAPKETS